jgi:GMP synthase (glutamine-hydrolysing)
MRLEKEKIIILDFGSQYTQLIARRIREGKVYSEIHPYNISPKNIESLAPKGIILSGGPSSVYEDKAPLIPKKILQMGIPILGICYGMQLICHLFGGKVAPHSKREYGKADLVIDSNIDLFNGFDIHHII